MNVAKIFRSAIAAALLVGSHAHADQILASFDYGDIAANRNYTTGAVKAFGAPIQVEKIEIKVFGDYCNIISREFVYNQEDGGAAIAARPDGEGGFIVNDKIYAMEYRFKQTKYNRVDCRLEIWGNGTSNTGSESNLQSDALSLSINSKLLNLAIGQNAEYQSLQVAAQNLRDYADYFADAVKAGESTERLSAIFKFVENSTRDFEAAFIPVHVRVRDHNIEDSWKLYAESFDRIEL
jgi:hypothetical protein